jgi:hypothetical protein
MQAHDQEVPQLEPEHQKPSQSKEELESALHASDLSYEMIQGFVDEGMSREIFKEIIEGHEKSNHLYAYFNILNNEKNQD